MAVRDDEISSERQRLVSVAARTDPGPREKNQDHVPTCRYADGFWLISVADGLGGHPRGVDAALVAIDSLPPRISTPRLCALCSARRMSRWRS